MQSQSCGAFRAARVLAVGGLLAVGLLLALPFRRRCVGTGSYPNASDVVVDVPLRRPDVTPEIGPAGMVSPAFPSAGESQGPNEFERSPRPELVALGPLPELPGQFGPAGAGPHPTQRRDWKPARLKLPDARPKERRHRLTDGDTLERLADRYLGNPARAPEIFAINGDLLTAPDLLPLGKIIRIPPPDEPPSF